MKLAIACNHSLPEHIGGSELVVHNLSKILKLDFDYEVEVFSRTCKEDVVYDEVKYNFCGSKPQEFFNKINRRGTDVLFVYSDYFTFWPYILRQTDAIEAQVAIAPVGMNYMANRKRDRRLFTYKQNLGVVSHSEYSRDFQLCRKHNIEPTLIPNGVDIDEFDQNEIDFKNKYEIGNPMVLCVSNFFPGKGQEYLPDILDFLYKYYQDFTFVLCYSSVNMSLANSLESKSKQVLENKPYDVRFLKNLPRQDIVSAFNAADVFALPSQKEVAPITILESMVSYTPWVALPVGNLKELEGGALVPFNGYDSNVYARYANGTCGHFACGLHDFLSDPYLNQKLAKKGRQMINDQFSWKNISKQYDDFFRGLNG